MELRAVLGEEWGSALPRTATGEAAVTRERTQDNVAAALSASLEPDRVFGVLETAPDYRLQHLPGQDRARRRRAVHLESAATERGLRSHVLFAVEHLALALATGHENQAQKQIK